MDSAKKGRLAKILSFLEDEGPPTDEEGRRPIEAFPPDAGPVGALSNAMMGPLGHTRSEAEYDALWNAPLEDTPPPPLAPAPDPLVERSQVAPVAARKTPRKKALV